MQTSWMNAAKYINTKYKVPTVCFHLNWNWSPERVRLRLRLRLHSTRNRTLTTSSVAGVESELAEEKQAPHQGEGESILKEDASLESTRRLFANTQKSEERSGRLKTERQRRRRRFSLFCFPVIFALWKLHYKQRQRNNENKIKMSWRLTKEYPVLKYIFIYICSVKKSLLECRIL